MTTLPLSEVKARLSEIADEVHRTHDRLLVTKNGREYLMVMSIEDYESLEATLELLADPKEQEIVRQAEEEVRRGEVYTLEDIEADLVQRRRREGSG
jgi:prevent-host-death family protein